MARSSSVLVRAWLVSTIAAAALAAGCGVPDIKNTPTPPDAGTGGHESGTGATGPGEGGSGASQNTGGTSVGGTRPADGSCNTNQDCIGWEPAVICDMRSGSAGAAGAGAGGKAGAGSGSGGISAGVAGIAGGGRAGSAGTAGAKTGGTGPTRTGKCVQCLKSTDCADGLYCSPAGTCDVGCAKDRSCPTGLTCDLSRNLCINCTVNTDKSDNCPPYTKCNLNGGTPGDGGILTDAGTLVSVCEPSCSTDVDCAAGWKCCGTRCRNIQTDLAHCGGCGKVCDLPNQAETCVNGTCTAGECDPNFGDCIKDDLANTETLGCETDLLASPFHCGKCDNGCVGSRECIFGKCDFPICGVGRANCDDNPATCETDITSNPANCGECGKACSDINGKPACAGAVCSIVCNSGYGNCDNDVTNGCESTFATDLKNCGACNTPCTTSFGRTECVGGHCTPQCTGLSGDCDQNPDNGCEDTGSSVANCGACGQRCTPANATPACNEGQCRITGCLAIGTSTSLYKDCDSDPTNGCETNPLSDVKNCSDCGKPCSTVGGTPSCANGVCTIVCSAGSADCNGSVTDGCEVNLNSDANNCKTCGNACTCANGTPNCIEGKCGCANCNDPSYGNCSGNGCVNNLQSDVLNCGRCGNACTVANGTPGCAAGQCKISQCSTVSSTVYADCDQSYANGCETPLNTVEHCGDCKVTCSPSHATGTCGTGTCGILSCEDGYADCDKSAGTGCEININSDIRHCGGCGQACSTTGGTPACTNRVCSITCDTSHKDCDGLASTGCEVNIAADPKNCGGCGQACSTQHATSDCSGSACIVTSCETGYGNCDGSAANGCEAQFATNVKHCGGCGKECILAHASPTCSGGACAIQACDPGWGNCDGNAANGCETPLNTVTNCGQCGGSCSFAHASASCSTGTCSMGVCDTGWGNCDGRTDTGCETSLLTDPNNCNGCGTKCSVANGSPGCSGGVCTIASCNTGYDNCDRETPVATGCEININNDPKNCGSCGRVCNLPNATAGCVAGACTVTACASGYDDCDKKPDNGCEVSLYTDANNCRTCGTVCSCPGGTPNCVAPGKCGCSSCGSGLGDCDSNGSCETNLTNDPLNCKDCGHRCTFANAGALCSASTCVLGPCTTGYGNCDSDATNGCETPTTTVANCGGCGLTCAVTNGTPGCSGTACTVAACNTGYGNCDNQYSTGCEVNLNADPAHCGSCTAPACAVANGVAGCAAGSCTVDRCNTGYADCDKSPGNGCEINTTNDAANCATCSHVCTFANAAASCSSSTCVMGACNGGWNNCDGSTANGCEINTTNDINHCGNCTTACTNLHGTTTCASGACAPVCSGDWRSCNGVASDGCETPIGTTDNCADCGNRCTYTNGIPGCVSKVCTLSGCNTGWDNCDNIPANGCETSLYSVTNCGSCGNKCTNAHGDTSCPAGVCKPTCQANYQDCNGIAGDGCETSLAANDSCGSCTNNCTDDYPHAAGVCSGSLTCAMGACNGGWGNCDGNAGNGCETDILTTLTACGGCNQSCSTNHTTAVSCVGGGCMDTCATGWGNCDNDALSNGCEHDLTNDAANCGACGKVCGGTTPYCVNSTCVGYLAIQVVNSSTKCSGTGASFDATDAGVCSHTLATARATDNHRAVLVLLAGFANTDPTSASVSVGYGAASMTLVPGSYIYTNNAFSAIYFIKDANLPATGGANAVTVSAPGAGGVVASIIELRGVDQTTTYDLALTNFFNNVCGSAPPSIAITPAADQELVVDVAGLKFGSGPGTPGGGQTKTLDAAGGSIWGIASYKLPVAQSASTPMNWTGNGCNSHVHSVAAFKRGAT